MSHFRWCSRSLSSAMSCQALSWLSEFCGIAQVQPPDMLTLPGAWPRWVGIAALPITWLHWGHGAASPSSQLCETQEPSTLIATPPLGTSCCDTVLFQFGSSACCGVGPSFSSNTVLMNCRESVNPGLPTTHFWAPLSYSVPPVPYSSISKPCIEAASPTPLPA